MTHSENINNIATIRLGITFRGKIENILSGEIAVFQPSNIKNGKLEDSPMFIESKNISSLEKHVLQPGEILLANKGLKFSSIIYDGTPNKAVASSSFFVITPNEELIHSKYLFWYLSQKKALDDLMRLVSGSTIPTLSKRALENFKVPVPDLINQKRIIKLVELVKSEREEFENLISKRKEYQDSYCWELIQSEI